MKESDLVSLEKMVEVVERMGWGQGRFIREEMDMRE
jgi:hypothetical protein